jgi:predicted nucleic acid-binding protein
VIVDSSAWIEFFRDARTGPGGRVASEIERDAPLQVPELVELELLSGTTNEERIARRRRFLHRFEMVPIVPFVDSVEAAEIQRRCRRAGESARSLIDCHLAATALRLDVPVMHHDRDFEVIRRHTGLRTVSLLT